MPWQFSIYLLPTFLAGAVASILAVVAWRRRDQRAAAPFVGLVAGLAIWAFAYGVELGFTTLGPMLWWDQVAFVGSVVVPTAWFLLAVEYAGYEEWLTRRTLLALVVEPALTLALVWTNDVHGLIWRETALDATGPIVVPALTFGPAYWANLAYSYLLLVAGFVLVGSVAVRGSRIYRRQSLLIFVGTLVPLAANALFNLFPSANPVGSLDLTPFAFAVSGVFYALALFRFRMLDLAPVARETLVEAMGDGVVVVDAEGTIVDCNSAASRAIGGEPIGEPIAETFLGDAPEVVERSVDGEARVYEVTDATLSDFRGDVVGRFFLLRDITEIEVLREHEQRLSVLNRVLRHNLRNELTVMGLGGRSLRESLSGEDAELARRLTEAVERMRSISEKARYVETTTGRYDPELVPVDLSTVARDVGDRIAAAHPAADVQVDVDADGGATALAIGSDELAVAVENLAENAVEHTPEEDPSVRLRAEADEDTVRLAVVDDGPGIPDAEWAALTADRESPLQHGSGLGLWLVRWIVEASDGVVTAATESDEGSEVVVALQRPPPEVET